MRFALLGDHPDGLAVAHALVATGRHALAAYHGPPGAAAELARRGLACPSVADLEELLADPAVELVVVASPIADRPAHLRRALQSERHVLCVHPVDPSPDVAYEAAMLRDDVRCLLLPLLPEALHPGLRRLAALAGADQALGEVRLVELEEAAPGPVLIDADTARPRPALLGWELLRGLGGPVGEVVGFAAGQEATAAEPLLVCGRFERGGLFRAAYLPGVPERRRRLVVLGSSGRAELHLAAEPTPAAVLTWSDAEGQSHREAWEPWDPWPALVGLFEEALARQPDAEAPPLAWQDAIRALELDDAVRRSVERRRASTLEYPEASEEVGFKGTMTLVGCGLLWTILVLLILSAWVPLLGWVIVPVLALFLGLQLLRWVVPARRKRERERASAE